MVKSTQIEEYQSLELHKRPLQNFEVQLQLLLLLLFSATRTIMIECVVVGAMNFFHSKTQIDHAFDLQGG